MIICPNCRRERSDPFCYRCGYPTEEKPAPACAHCGKEKNIAGPYCPHCGKLPLGGKVPPTAEGRMARVNQIRELMKGKRG